MNRRIGQIGLIVGSFGLCFLLWYFLLRSPKDSPRESKSPPLVTSKVEVARSENKPAPPPPSPPVSPPLPPALDRRTSEEVVGIGAAISMVNDEEKRIPQITNVLPGSPAESAGLSGPLRIHKIDDVPTDGMALPECVRMIRGAIGTRVRLELSRPTEEGTFTVEIIRQKLTL